MSDAARVPVTHLLLFMVENLPEAGVFERFLLLLRKREGFLVSGDSMLPTLKHGDAVLVDPRAVPGIGDVVLARHPYKDSVKILKRVAGIDELGKYSLVGDNPAESTDSRTFGMISIEYILGKVTCRLK